MATARGTGPTHVFNLPFNASNMTKVYITYAQGGVVLFEKTIDDISITGEKQISVQLTQTDTLKLDENKKLKFQIRCEVSGVPMASYPIERDVIGILKDGVI